MIGRRKGKSPPPGPVVRGKAHEALIVREAAISTEKAALGQDPYPAIIADRRRRWQSHYDQMNPSPAVDDWAARMGEAHGPTVVCWRMRMIWPIALLVVRYGEAEDFWPQEFSAADLARARAWEAGNLPLPVEWAEQHPGTEVPL